MELKQVAIIALRAPNGSCLPPIPINKKLPAEPTRTEELASDELAKLFVQRIKNYKKHLKKLSKNTSNKTE